MTKELRSGGSKGGGNRPEAAEERSEDWYRSFHDVDDEDVDDDDDDDELRLNVFREVLMTGWYPRSPRYCEARPRHFPREITVFHTGALYGHIQTRAVPTLFPFYNVVRTVTFLVLLVSLVVAYANSPLLHDTNDDDDDDETRTMKYASYYVHAIGLYAIAGAVSYLPTRLAVRRFHDRMAAVVQELSPLFRKAGYDIQYCRSSWNNGTGSGGSDSSQNRSFLSRCGAAVASLFHNESFVRFVPYPRALSSEEVDKARVLWDVPTTAVTTTTARTGFRVAVYGFLACPELGSVKSQGANFFSSLRVVGATDHVDLFTRGAVATEMRPYAEMYRQARFWTTLAALVACIIPMWMPDWFYKSWFSIIGLFGVLIAAELVLFCPTGLETWWLLHVRRQPVFDQMRATIQRLSPLVEERAGYSLRLQVEPDGCLGGTAAYVHFEPTSSSPSAGGGDAGGGPVLC